MSASQIEALFFCCREILLQGVELTLVSLLKMCKKSESYLALRGLHYRTDVLSSLYQLYLVCVHGTKAGTSKHKVLGTDWLKWRKLHIFFHIQKKERRRSVMYLSHIT